MKRKLVGPIVIGVVGVGILLFLGIWQVQRLGWKQGVLTQIETRIEAAPVVDLPLPVIEERDKYLSVLLTGTIGREEIHVLASRKQIGAGYRLITPFDVMGMGGMERRILLDRGFIALDAKDAVRIETQMSVVGNLHWPDETDSYTPEPDVAKEIWFARDVAAMAAALGTEPVLLIARSNTGDGTDPHPVETAGIPNDHLNYAITWFSLALVWFGMTLFLLWRIKRQTA